MSICKPLSIILLCLCTTLCAAEGTDTTATDTLPHAQRFDRLSSSRLFQMTYIGAPLIVGGLLAKGEDDHFRSLRNDYMPQFRRHFDDYLQYTPAAAMLAMKFAGVEGRSSWGRMLTSDAFTAAIMAAAVNTMKHTANVTRPDGSDNHSFPSGHTATAFMTATMLNKEYGHISPWIGVGAYTAATATGLMRMANNKHWLSDILTGAGIGVLSTELGYYLADLIFRDKGISHHPQEESFSITDRPTFLGLYLGCNVPLSHYDIDERHVFRTSSGSTGGIEGAYFFTPYIGVGGRFTVSNTRIIVNDTEAEENTLDILNLSAGAYASIPLTPRWLLGGKLLASYVHYPALELTGSNIPGSNGAGLGSGVSIGYRAKEHLGFRLFLDYDLIPPHSSDSGEYMNTLTVGAAFSINM